MRREAAKYCHGRRIGERQRVALTLVTDRAQQVCNTYVAIRHFARSGHLRRDDITSGAAGQHPEAEIGSRRRYLTFPSGRPPDHQFDPLPAARLPSVTLAAPKIAPSTELSW